MVTLSPEPGAGATLLPTGVKPSVEPSNVHSFSVLTGLPFSSKPPEAAFQRTGPARSTNGAVGAAGAAVFAVSAGRPQAERAARRTRSGQALRFTGELLGRAIRRPE